MFPRRWFTKVHNGILWSFIILCLGMGPLGYVLASKVGIPDLLAYIVGAVLIAIALALFKQSGLRAVQTLAERLAPRR